MLNLSEWPLDVRREFFNDLVPVLAQVFKEGSIAGAKVARDMVCDVAQGESKNVEDYPTSAELFGVWVMENKAALESAFGVEIEEVVISWGDGKESEL